MDAKNIGKLTYTVNTAILGMVLGLMVFFYVCKATFLVYFSIPTIFVYLIGYLIIYKKMLAFYVWMVYLWITLYMGVCTICLGFKYGFHLYSLSMIPIIYYTNYIAYKIGRKRVKAAFFSFIIISCYLGCTIFVSFNGPIYQGSNISEAVFWITNSIIVFWFLIFYTKMLIRTTIESEEKLKELSYVDRLTDLYNRHYMMDKLESANANTALSSVALIDIDDFKKINDVYGHNAGDYVLQNLSQIMKDTCDKAVISRWGGEEFLLLFDNISEAKDMMERLRMTVENTKFDFEDNRIRVSVTIGVAERGEQKSIDKWIQVADDRLYIGKKQGKNKIIYED